MWSETVNYLSPPFILENRKVTIGSDCFELVSSIILCYYIVFYSLVSKQPKLAPLPHQTYCKRTGVVRVCSGGGSFDSRWPARRDCGHLNYKTCTRYATKVDVQLVLTVEIDSGQITYSYKSLWPHGAGNSIFRKVSVSRYFSPLYILPLFSMYKKEGQITHKCSGRKGFEK